MQKLARGIHRFQQEYFATHRELFEQLATKGQRPETLFITCSDSRVIPELITDAPDDSYLATVGEYLDLLKYVRLVAAQAVIA